MVNIHAMHALARDLLSKAETMFGPRDTRFQFLGILIEDDGPRIRFNAHGGFGVYIALKSIASADEHMAIHQLCSHSAGSNNMDGYRIRQVGHDFVVFACCTAPFLATG